MRPRIIRFLSSMGCTVRRPPRRICTVEKCKRRTNDGKPYCTDHVFQIPYVVELLKRLHEGAA